MIPGRGLKDIRTPIGALASRDGCTPLKARTKLMSLQVEKNHLEKEVKRMEERLVAVNTRLKEIKAQESRLFPQASIDSAPSGNGERRLPGLPTGNERTPGVKERLMSF
ncbi:MAG: hypothetical protein Q6354_09585 [Candidatus Brocadiales bacterium]|nr:hypothetical protein [Candidatus Brocadiales bacterium]